jgi:DNA-binding winged helix-turn-helix (wHTH) protein/TolB-like protein
VAASARKISRFGGFEFDATSGELRSGDTRVRLEPQPARVLALLVDRAGAVVTRNELHEHVWQADTFVDFDRGLNYCVAQIRAALGDSASSPRFIETLPRRGYRFIAAVSDAGETAVPGTGTGARDADDRVSAARDTAATAAIESESESAAVAVAESAAESESGSTATLARAGRAALTSNAGASSHAHDTVAANHRPRPRWMLLAGLVLGGILGFAGISFYLAKADSTPGDARATAASTAPADGRVRLAVALFDNETGDAANDPLVQQFTDLVVTRLAANPDRLGVIGNAAILRERRRFRDVKAIAAALGVQYVVLGQLQPRARVQPGTSGSTTGFRLLVHLIRTDDETHLWANRYELDAQTRPSVEAEMPAALERAIAERVLHR